MGLRDRVKRLEKEAEGDTTVVRCPTCGEVFTLHGDPAMEYLAWQWLTETGSENLGRPIDPALVAVAEHEHDPAAFVERRSGLPFLSRAVSGMDLGGRA